jgi:hypothetical protein
MRLVSRPSNIRLFAFLGLAFGLGRLALYPEGLQLAFAFAADFFLSFAHGMFLLSTEIKNLRLHTISETGRFVNNFKSVKKRPALSRMAG